MAENTSGEQKKEPLWPKWTEAWQGKWVNRLAMLATTIVGVAAGAALLIPITGAIAGLGAAAAGVTTALGGATGAIVGGVTGLAAGQIKVIRQAVGAATMVAGAVVAVVAAGMGGGNIYRDRSGCRSTCSYCRTGIDRSER